MTTPIYVSPDEFVNARMGPVSKEMRAQGVTHLMAVMIPNPNPRNPGAVVFLGHGDFDTQTSLMRQLAKVLNEHADAREKTGSRGKKSGLILPPSY
jgi:hypothetical protein